MSTVSRNIFMDILRNNGRYFDDPIPLSLWTYKNIFNGKLSFKVCYDRRAEESLFDSDAATNSPRLVWTKDGITPYGETL